VSDEDKLADWLADNICPAEMSRDRLRSALLIRCHENRMEPPKTTRIERVLGAAELMFERQFTETTVACCRPPRSANCRSRSSPMTSPRTVAPTLTPGARALRRAGEEQAARAARRAFLQELKEDPGSFQLDTLLAEIVKLERVKAIGANEKDSTPGCGPCCAAPTPITTGAALTGN
jgi:hypothetical protein